MTEAFVARQPIFDTRLQIYAYELLFRSSGENAAGERLDGGQATSQVIWNTFTVFGLDSLVGGARAFINFNRDLLLDDSSIILPPDRVVIELLEDMEVDQDLVDAVTRLADKGYTIALDDFSYQASWQPLVDVAHIVKLDVMALTVSELEEHMSLLQRHDLKMLAEKVETAEQYEQLKAMGFDYFQGYFLARPMVMKGRRTPADRTTILRLLARLNDPTADITDIEALISRDISLSYKLLRYINSALFSLPRRVDSTRTAIVLLGLVNIRRWASLIAMSGFNDKPGDLLGIALVRGRMGQNLAEAAGLADPDSHFTVGLFSALDALLDMPMEQVVEELPLGEDVVNALLHRQGPLGATLACALAYEHQDWDHVALDGLDARAIRDAYLSAVAWATHAEQELPAGD